MTSDRQTFTNNSTSYHHNHIYSKTSFKLDTINQQLQTAAAAVHSNNNNHTSTTNNANNKPVTNKCIEC